MRDIVEKLEQAAALRGQGNPTGALQLLADVAQVTPERADLAYQTAWVLDVLGHDRDAVEHYRRALTLDQGTREGGAPTEGALSAEDRKGAYLGLGLVLTRLDEPTTAIDELRHGVHQYPEDAQLRTLLALAQTMANRQAPPAGRRGANGSGPRNHAPPQRPD